MPRVSLVKLEQTRGRVENVGCRKRSTPPYIVVFVMKHRQMGISCNLRAEKRFVSIVEPKFQRIRDVEVVRANVSISHDFSDGWWATSALRRHGILAVHISEFDNHVLSLRKFSDNVFINYDVEASRIDMSHLCNAIRIDLEFCGDAIDQVLDSSLRKVYSAVILLGCVLLADVEACN